MANRHRGEIEVELDGCTLRLRLTLGALAELEQVYGDTDLLALAERFETGRIGASDAIRLIGAGLRGAGEEISDEEVACMASNAGAAGYVAICAELLQATFSPAGGENEPAGN